MLDGRLGKTNGVNNLFPISSHTLHNCLHSSSLLSCVKRWPWSVTGFANYKQTSTPTLHSSHICVSYFITLVQISQEWVCTFESLLVAGRDSRSYPGKGAQNKCSPAHHVRIFRGPAWVCQEAGVFILQHKLKKENGTTHVLYFPKKPSALASNCEDGPVKPAKVTANESLTPPILIPAARENIMDRCLEMRRWGKKPHDGQQCELLHQLNGPRDAGGNIRYDLVFSPLLCSHLLQTPQCFPCVFRPSPVFPVPLLIALSNLFSLRGAYRPTILLL